MDINELAKALDNLSPGDALALLDSIARVQERATKEREEKAAAERERDERYPMCTCGKPAKEAMFFHSYAVNIEPGVKRQRDGTLRGGIVFVGDSDVYDAPEQEDLQRIDKTMWVNCGECTRWHAIENGFDLKVGEEW
jgi:hypothetical protein